MHTPLVFSQQEQIDYLPSLLEQGFRSCFSQSEPRNLNHDDGGSAPNVKIANDREEKADGRLIRMAQRLDVIRFTDDLGHSIASSSLNIRTGCFFGN
jgi:hypothetical protein